MEQTKPDLWALKTNPTITSFFNLSLTDGKSLSINKAPVSSGKCGLGWRFVFQATNEEGSKSIWSGSKIDTRTLFKISLANHHTATANLDKLSITVEAVNDKAIMEMSFHATEISLSGAQVIHLASILAPANFTGDIAVQIRVKLPETFDLEGDPSKGSEQKLRRSVAKSLLNAGQLGDIGFALFNRRGGNDVTDPEIMFANSSLIRGHSTFFDDLLSETSTEREVLAVGDLAPPIYNAYDYMSDSDLESELELDDDSDDFGSQSCTSSTLTSAQHQRKYQHRDDQPMRQNLHHHEPVILVRDTAFATWKALVFYFYTREIHFRPLKSSSSTLRDAEVDGNNVSCSPKSMYRLATKIGFEELKTLSLKAITRGISKGNVVQELFSSFTSVYPEVQKAEVDVLIPLLKEFDVAQKLVDRMESAPTRGPPHCGAVIAAVAAHLVALAVNERPCLVCLARETEDEELDDEDEGDDPDDEDDQNKSRDDHKGKGRQGDGKKRQEDGKNDGDKYKTHWQAKNASEGDKSKLPNLKTKPGEGDKAKQRSSQDKYTQRFGPFDQNGHTESYDDDMYSYADGFSPAGKKKKGSRYEYFGQGD